MLSGSMEIKAEQPPQPFPLQNHPTGQGNVSLDPLNTPELSIGEGFAFPLADRPRLPYSTGGRAFGATRGQRLHAGCDLIAPEGTPVYAIADGEVSRVYTFLEGRRANGEEWSVSAIEIDHGEYTARYGEIRTGSTSGLTRGSRVTRGQQIAEIGRMDTDSMLHFEMYSNDATGRLTVRSNPPYQRRIDLIDPTPFLDAMTLIGD